MAEEIKFSEFTAADPATLEAAGGIVPSAVAGIGNHKSTWTQIKNWITTPLLALINNMVDKTESMLQTMVGGLRATYFSGRWFEMDIEDSQPTSVKGAMWYGSEDNLPVVNLDYNVTGALLDDVITPAINKTGSVIPNGTVCYVSGSQGNRTVVSLAQAVLTPTTQIAIVVATHDVAVDTVGYFVNRGLVNQLNTSAYTEGQVLWVSTTAGQLTGAAPAKPYSQIAVGVVTRVHATVGQIRVFPYPIPRIGQLTDVNTTGIVAGQALRLSSSGVFEPYTPLDTVKRNVTVSVNAGWYRLGYVDLKVNTFNSVFGEVYYSSASFTGLFSFSATRNNTPNTLNISTFYSVSCQNPPSVQWEVLGNGDIRVSWYAYFNAYHSAFAMYNIGSSASLTNAYTHEYIGATKPANTELVNCLDRVTLTDEPAQDVLPSGAMTQPTAIQWLRNNVKQLFAALTNKLDRVIDAGRLLISYAGDIRVNVGASNFDFTSIGINGISPAPESNSKYYATTEWVRKKFVPSSIGADITSNSTITPVDGELRIIQNPSEVLTVTITNTPIIGTISYIGVKFSAGCSIKAFRLNYTDFTGTSASELLYPVDTSTSAFGLYFVRIIKGNTGWIIDR